MNILPVIEIDQLAYWANADEIERATVTTFKAPPSMEKCSDCQAVLTKSTDGEIVVRVPWKLSDEEVYQLMMGGTLWLSTWGGLPPHMLEVQPAPPSAGS